MKTYVKPELYFESFELSQHIAACDIKLTNPDIWSCRADLHDSLNGFFGGLESEFADAFASGTDSCSKNPIKDFEIFCYTNGNQSIPRVHCS